MISFTVKSGIHPDPASAMKDAAERRSSLLAQIGNRHPDAEVSDTDISTREEIERVEQVRVESGTSSTTSDWRTRGYSASSTITIESDIGDTAALIATGGFAATSGSPRFRLTEETAYRVARELDAKAVKDARIKAVAIAAAESLKVGALLSVGENPPPREFGLEADGDRFSRLSDASGDTESSLGEVRPHPVVIASSLPVRFVLTR